VSAKIDDDVERTTRLRGIQANGAHIYRARRLQGLTQEALASAADCDEKTIRRAEKGCRLDIATLLRIAKALKLPYRGVVR
jgi:transcriptional regulator with XRE-family HTH domain